MEGADVQAIGPGRAPRQGEAAMDGSWTIRVRKRDGTIEAFDSSKLAAAMVRGMSGTCAGLWHARELAEAVEIHFRRSGVRSVSSAMVFEMTCKALRRVGLGLAATAMESHRADRRRMRRLLRSRPEKAQTVDPRRT